MRILLSLAVALGLLGVWAWVSDFVTMQGERTIYTVRCDGGQWQDLRCVGGRLMQAERYRYRALRLHGEVLFWQVGSTEPSGKFSQCTIHDGRNWTCKPGPDTPRSITLAMHLGLAQHGDVPPLRPFHAVSKWRWMLLGLEVPLGDTADY